MNFPVSGPAPRIRPARPGRRLKGMSPGYGYAQAVAVPTVVSVVSPPAQGVTAQGSGATYYYGYPYGNGYGRSSGRGNMLALVLVGGMLVWYVSRQKAKS